MLGGWTAGNAKHRAESVEIQVNTSNMQWISVKDRQPEKGHQVLVRGWLSTDLTERDEEVDVTIGLANWDSPDYSECSDTCYYSMWYSGITHWSPVVFEAEQEVQGE